MNIVVTVPHNSIFHAPATNLTAVALSLHLYDPLTYIWLLLGSYRSINAHAAFRYPLSMFIFNNIFIITSIKCLFLVWTSAQSIRFVCSIDSIIIIDTSTQDTLEEFCTEKLLQSICIPSRRAALRIRQHRRPELTETHLPVSVADSTVNSKAYSCCGFLDISATSKPLECNRTHSTCESAIVVDHVAATFFVWLLSGAPF